MEKKTKKIFGKIVKGLQKASYFTALDWVQDQCMVKLGFRPYPGTVNLQIEAKYLKVLEQWREETCEELMPPNRNFCSAKVQPVTIGNERAAILIPDEDVRVHGAAILEIIAPNRLKDALNVEDGDSLTVVLTKSE